MKEPKAIMTLVDSQRWIFSDQLSVADLQSKRGGFSPSQNTIYGESFVLGNQVQTEYYVKRTHESEAEWIDVQDMVEEDDGWHSAWRTFECDN